MKESKQRKRLGGGVRERFGVGKWQGKETGKSKRQKHKR